LSRFDEGEDENYPHQISRSHRNLDRRIAGAGWLDCGWRADRLIAYKRCTLLQAVEKTMNFKRGSAKRGSR
jgi:hypothetical protein